MFSDTVDAVAATPRYTYLSLLCAFCPRSGMRVMRRLVVAINNSELFARLTVRASGAEVPVWKQEQADFAIQCARRFCQRRYALEDAGSISVLEVSALEDWRSALSETSLPHELDEDALVWVQREEPAAVAVS